MKIIIGASGGIGNELYNHYLGVGTYMTNGMYGLYKVDITDYSQVETFAKEIKPNYIDLINCAGINYDSFAHKSDPAKWKQIVDINLIGTYNVIRAFLPYMREQNYGRIILLGSVVAQKGIMGTSAYACSKSALWGLTRAVAVENARKNVLINIINLGYMAAGMINEIPEEIQAQIIKTIPCNKLGTVGEIINTIDYLVKSNYITGTSIDLNGGLI